MIRLSTVLFFFITISVCASGQSPPRRASKIVLINSFTKEENYLEVGKILLTNNFTIDYNDKELGFLNASYPGTKSTTEMKLTVVVESGQVIVTGKCKRNHSTDYYIQLQNIGRKRGFYDHSFDLMHQLAMKIPHDDVNYEISAD